ncbi:hypothetical protein ACRALDRAFT_213156 [Sodiomyces alcalophilus JCM 7366]|uniref:uncharacterized protein n=1 Tax=Sodiomyces alcalophilus JCM 7366 TaxID=591952 RepID=UPI0039B5BAE8
MSFDRLPWDIKHDIFRRLTPQDPQPYHPDLESVLNRRLSRLASVNQQWQAYFEPFNFRSLGLTNDSLSQFASYVGSKRRSLVKKIHLHVWAPKDFRQTRRDTLVDEDERVEMVKKEFSRVVLELFDILSLWPPKGPLHLVLSVAVRTPRVSDKAFFTAGSHPTWSHASRINRILNTSSTESNPLTPVYGAIGLAVTLPCVYAVTSFSANRLWGKCAIAHPTLSHIIDWLPMVKEVDIDMAMSATITDLTILPKPWAAGFRVGHSPSSR